ncbi:hypothetical protein [Streptomyces sp. NPDC048442]|uniref:hypothetical protein n=1 Tax=Streptomyces sp. NPDC048442 TaxID=3154823 RepID=UPI0034146AC0
MSVLRCTRIVIVQSELGPRLLDMSSMLEEIDFSLLLTDDVEEELSRCPTGVAVLPALNELQVGRVSEVAERFPLASVIGVVHEAEGYRTREVIQAGAVLAMNVLIPIEEYREALRTVARRCEEMVYWSSVKKSGDRSYDGEFLGLRDEGEIRLARLLCSFKTTVEIADALFCSERSAYRRIRSLYVACGVRNRSELRELAARSGMARVS